MSKTKSWMIFAALLLLAAAGTFRLLMRQPEYWKPAFLAKTKTIPIDESSIARENPFRIHTGPRSSTVIDSSEVSCRDHLIEGDFDHVLATAKRELPKWSEEAVGDGRMGSQSAATMDRQLVGEMLAVKVYRKQVGNLTRVRIWYHHPRIFKMKKWGRLDRAKVDLAA